MPPTGSPRLWPCSEKNAANFLLVHLAGRHSKSSGNHLAYCTRRPLRAFFVATPLGFIAIEAGWMVTEMGRQPWIIYGIMRTKDAVTSMPGLAVPFYTITLLYLMLSVTVVLLLKRQFLETIPVRKDK